MSSGKPRRSYSRALMLAAVPLLAAAHAPRPEQQLMLDAAQPFVQVTIAGVPLRLRVDPAEHGLVLLDRAAADRLPLTWTEDAETDVGRIRLAGHVARATLLVDGHSRQVSVAAYERDCCRDADGAVGPDTLPYAVIRWSRADAPDPTGERTMALAMDMRSGLHADAGPQLDGLQIAFTLYRSDTVATAAGGAILARAWGGAWTGPATLGRAAFGLLRPIRPMAFALPQKLAGFPIRMIDVRTADFGGRSLLPQDKVGPDDIIVSRRLPLQDAWPAVILGPDVLRRCAEIVYVAAPRSLTLRCAFEAR
ncbi:hypothetical protein [Sphingomonas nostoxanthinifaciens]|uniref:hypothetical protein n=1 Tax=Sphingomonas nostoxanthinifaciens TaxID=2872652 RepID=UPI001CC1F179|nr:hypothetical protein [Sphingomonas nostoxanthinifaciens]UAK26370.1 hypothetical protein K8P63_09935 [Sphingomonas nostoxanthinifaciens]